MVQVRVYRISSVTEPSTGLPAKQIELVEVKQRGGQPYGGGDESRMVQNMVNQLQSMGLVPKITMVLTESEYDMFGLRLDVNDIYDLEIKNGSISLKKSTEGT